METLLILSYLVSIYLLTLLTINTISFAHFAWAKRRESLVKLFLAQKEHNNNQKIMPMHDLELYKRVEYGYNTTDDTIKK